MIFGWIAVVMPTVNRAPRRNYLQQSLLSLYRSGAFESPSMLSFTVVESNPETTVAGDLAWPLGLTPNVRVPDAPRGANANIAAALMIGWGTGAEWVLLLEDDVEVCADFVNSAARWLSVHAVEGYGMYTFGSARPEIHRAALEGQEAWEVPLGQFYGTQAIAIHSSRISGAVDAIAAAGPEWEGRYDLVLARWCMAQGEGILASCPSFAQHVGEESFLRPGGQDFGFPSWPGAGWAYGDPYLGFSSRIRLKDFQTSWFRRRAGEMQLTLREHRKVWEFALIAQLFRQRFGEGAGVEALGFGVGTEPLPAWLAAQGARVVATDQSAETAGAWASSGQHLGTGASPWQGICSREQFESIRFRDLDMRAIEGDLRQGEFDFTWSAGSFEHLGGIEAGIQFFLNQMKCLRPGGLAVHTTEYNFADPDETIDAVDLCLFRGKDLEELRRRLSAQGDYLWPLDLAPGAEEGDKLVLAPPYEGYPHLNIQVGKHVTTSIVLVAERGR